MYDMRFGEPAPQRRSVDQLRGIEGARVRRLYDILAQRHGVKWKRRQYDPSNWDASDLPNRCLSQATSCLYGLAEAAILAAGYAPAIGFLHTGKPQSFVYDVADVFKFDTVVPVAFQVAGQAQRGQRPAASDPIGEVRRGCRDRFRKAGTLNRADSGHRRNAGRGRSGTSNAPERSTADCHSRGAERRCWSSWLTTLRRDYAVAWRYGSSRSGQASMLAITHAATREMIWEQVKAHVGDGDAIIAWAAPERRRL